jgi:hypothetical protein
MLREIEKRFQRRAGKFLLNLKADAQLSGLRQRTEHRLFVPKLIKERIGCGKLARRVIKICKNFLVHVLNCSRRLFSPVNL